MLIFLIILYLMSGIGGFVFWWTKDNDLTTEEIPLLIVIAFVGPLSWIIGYQIHEENKPKKPKKPKTFMKKRF